jgi:hypothetical protein
MMTFINKDGADNWIEKNHPENGVFRVYWSGDCKWVSGSSLRYKKPNGIWAGGARTMDGAATLDPDEGKGLRYEWEYKDGKRADGESKSWFPNGQIRTLKTWKNGQLNGPHIFWKEHGQKQVENFFSRSFRHGKQTYWYDNGVVQKTEFWIQGTKHGKWEKWGNNGKYVGYQVWENGKLVKKENWD